ncbi:hypothetical protein SDC9_151386 [bioreactor metagenome]|uniref:Uncharacterized protein n=1 Tax=bioreactor metagenome TaxID=1076179 RepID=A0A645ERX3_9ZZZZ
MPLKGHNRITAVHAGSVIDYLNIGYSAFFDIDFNGTGLCINGIFNQFLHNPGWSFNDFSSSDHICQVLV